MVNSNMAATELKELADANGFHDPGEESTGDGAAGPKDDRPLLKSDSVAAESIEEMEKKYAAYVRKDAYGTMGRGELPMREKVLLGFAMITLVPIRVVIGIVILLIYYLICRVCTLFKDPNREDEQEDYAHMDGWRREAVVRCGRFLSRVMLFNFGFYWIKETRRDSLNENDCRNRQDDSERPSVIVANHVSYLDILYPMSAFFPSFVAKRSVGKLPFIGLISKCLGCVFVQRESKSSDFKGVSCIITGRILEAQQNSNCPMMLLFPEGTTTNGDYLLPFRTGAFLAKVPVRPVILRYPYKRFSPAWDSIAGARHMFLLLCQFVNYMEVIHLPVYYPSQQEKEDPKLYASNVRRFMAAEGNLLLSDIGLPEKRIYHAALNGNSLPRVLHQKDD